MYTFNFNQLELAVRSTCVELCKADIQHYVHSGLHRAQAMPCATSTKAAHLRVVNTLVNVMCDTAIHIKARRTCFRAIKQLKPLLHTMMTAHEYQTKSVEIQQLAHYFVEASLPDNLTPHSTRKALKVQPSSKGKNDV